MNWEDLVGKITCADCFDILKQLPDKCIDLVLTDPPYNIKKADWDSWEIQDEYINWLGGIFRECQRILKPNGSFYFFHNDFLQIVELQNYINKNTDFIFRQFIVWNKKFSGSKNEGFLQGYNEIENLRNYQKFAEYCLYYTLQDGTGLTKTQGHCCYPIRDYIRNEIIRAKGKIVLKEINKALGTATNGGGVASAVLSLDKEIPAFITKEHYEKLQNWLNTDKECKYLRKEYEYLRKEYEDLRYTFNNQKTHHSVWDFEIAEKEQNGHITPKPIPLIENILKYSSNENDLVLDCFSGSGTTAVACHKLKRRFICIEKDPEYCKASQERLKQAQRQQMLF